MSFTTTPTIPATITACSGETMAPFMSSIRTIISSMSQVLISMPQRLVPDIWHSLMLVASYLTSTISELWKSAESRMESLASNLLQRENLIFAYLQLHLSNTVF